jgi:hypothetical protein
MIRRCCANIDIDIDDDDGVVVVVVVILIVDNDLLVTTFDNAIIRPVTNNARLVLIVEAIIIIQYRLIFPLL